MKTLSITAGAVVTALLVGCASAPPPELRNARSAYQDASQAPGSNLVSADVYEARKALESAETAFSEEGNEAETRDLAYIAERKSISARAKSNIALSNQQKQVAIAEGERWKQQQAALTKQQLGQTKEQLAMSQQQLESERQARMDAERRTQDMLTKIQGMTTKTDERGLVLTLSGSVLFATGKSELLPGAQKRLNDVIAALKEDKRGITIVGHTDSVGSDSDNMSLSQRRADAVRTYLVTHDIPEDRVQAQGMGESQPVADNKSAEGRANNRRVEIILRGDASSSGKLPGSGSTNGSGTTPANPMPGSGTQR